MLSYWATRIFNDHPPTVTCCAQLALQRACYAALGYPKSPSSGTEPTRGPGSCGTRSETGGCPPTARTVGWKDSIIDFSLTTHAVEPFVQHSHLNLWRLFFLYILYFFAYDSQIVKQINVKNLVNSPEILWGLLQKRMCFWRRCDYRSRRPPVGFAVPARGSGLK